MEKAIYVILAVMVAAAVGLTYTMITKDAADNTYLPDLSEYDQRIANTLGWNPGEDVRYLLPRPDLPLYNYPLQPKSDIEYLIYLKDGKNINNRKVVKELDRLYEELNQWFYVYGKRDNRWLFAGDDVNVTVFYDQLVVAATLVTYQGNPITAAEIQKINAAAEQLAAEFNLTLEYRETVEEAVSRAKDLSDFFYEYDQWITFNLLATEDKPYTGRELHDALIGLGFRWGEFNNYHWINPDDYVGYKYLLSVGNYDYEGEFIPEEMIQEDYTTSGIIVGYYLPTCPAPVEIYDNLITTLMYLMGRLGGTIVNSQGQVMNSDSLKRIREVVSDMTQEMEDYGIKPGHDRALWIFDY